MNRIPENHLFLDCDGVLANFDKHASELLGGVSAREFKDKFGEDKLWEILKSEDPEFWLNLELMPDAMILYNSTKHLRPTILTGIPTQMRQSARQKEIWVEKHFGKSQKLICCRVSHKSNFCEFGDILVDDRIISKKKWEKAGGIFIFHNSALESIKQLHKLFIIS